MKVVFIIVGVVVLLLGALLWLGSGPESKVKLANEMDKYALDYLEQHHVLDKDEKVIAYFDETIKMDGSEAALVTNQRLLYIKDGRTTAMALSQIEDVKHEKETLTGDIITVRAKSGESIRVEVAPYNGGETFYAETMAAWKRSAPAAPPANH